MLEGHHLPGLSQLAHGLGLPRRLVVRDQVYAFRRQHKEATDDKAAVATGFFGEGRHGITVALQRTVASGRLHRGDSSESAVLLVKGDRGADIDVAQTIAVGEAETLVVLHVVGHSPEAAAGQGVFTGIDQRDTPGLGFLLVHLHLVFCHV